MANQIFADVVIEKKFESVLNTKLDFQRFVTVDRDLAENSGMTKNVVVKSVTGNVQDLAMGVGNTQNVEVTSQTIPYTVGVTQGRFSYYDEEAMSDDSVVEAGLTGLAEKMVNDFTNKAVAAFAGATLEQTGCTWIFDDVVDALAKLNLENESDLFMLIAPSVLAEFRKNLGTSLQYSEGFVRTGYIGSVCGIPVYVTKALDAVAQTAAAIIASKEAVTLFIKKGVEREPEREANTRKTTEYIRKVALVALTDDTKVIRLHA